MKIIDIVILLLVIILVILFFTNTTNTTTEEFDLGVGLRQLPYHGQYYKKNEIGQTFVNNSCACKKICNILGSCRGISYNPSNKMCKTFSDTSQLIYDQAEPDYLSWKVFGTTIY